MKVFILTEGGMDIGFGHITRCISLCQAFEEKGVEPELIINGDESLEDLLKDKNYQIFNWLKEENKLYEIAKKADIVIVDSYLTQKSLYDRIYKITNGRLVMIDDFNRIEYPKGIIINPSIYGDRFNYPQKDGIYLLGKDYIILRKEFWDVPKKRIGRQVKNILITFGGMNHIQLADKLLKYLKERFNFNFHILNANNKLTAKQMLNLMLRVDICISGGGQTTYELARVGVPAIGICFAENQLYNLKYGQKLGYLKFASWFDDEDLFSNIENSLKDLNYSKRIKMRNIGQKFVDGKGSNRLVSRVIER